MKACIRLTPSMVQDFVNVTSKCNFDIDIAGYHRYSVDAKSIVGILGLDMSKPLTVTYYGYNEALESFLSRHALAS